LVVLYVVSAEEAAGKTLVCAGLGRSLLNEGKKVGFLKPVSTEKSGADGDAAFMKQVLDLSEAVESLCPPIVY
jgi:dethiobiotin synthetase